MGIPLSALEGRFVRLAGEHRSYRLEPTIESADGISFVCPLCFLALKDQNFDPNVGVRGVHSVLCWRPRVPADVSPGPGRWDLQGTGLSDVTLVAGSSSIQLIGGCAWHGYVRNGECVDDLGPESVERARKYHAATRQRIIDQETKMTGTNTSTQTATSTATATQTGAPPTSRFFQGEGQKSAVLADWAPPGFTRTEELKYFGDTLYQKFVSGHDPNRDPTWVEIPSEKAAAEPVGTSTETSTATGTATGTGTGTST